MSGLAKHFAKMRQVLLPKHKFRLEEDNIPIDARGKPDLSRYTKPLAHYISLYEASMTKIAEAEFSDGRANLAFRQRVHATWGLLAKGSEAIPFLLTLVGRKDSDAREDASFLLGELKRTDGIADVLLAQLNNEKDLVAQSAMIQALGKLRYQPAAQAMARLILSDDVDSDIRLDAADSLGRIVKIAFSESGDPLPAAISWLATQGYSREGSQ
jgi:hypothetical protein